jgi:arginyl-tRNA synthetase
LKKKLLRYLNIYFDSAVYAKIVQNIISDPSGYGKGSADQTIMVEYSQPNTHKAFHVGHLKIWFWELQCAGSWSLPEQVDQTNYISDIRLHVIKWLWNYMNYHRVNYLRLMENTRMGASVQKQSDDLKKIRPDIQVRELFKRWIVRIPDPSLGKKPEISEAFAEVYKLLGLNSIRFADEVEIPERDRQQ